MYRQNAQDIHVHRPSIASAHKRRPIAFDMHFKSDVFSHDQLTTLGLPSSGVWTLLSPGRLILTGLQRLLLDRDATD